MNKTIIVEKIKSVIALQANHLLKAALNAHQDATNGESKAENKYDTRGLEAAYLAEGQAKMAGEVQHMVSIYNHLELQEFAENDAIGVTALVAMVDVENENAPLHYFIGPKGGGITIELDGKEVVLITAASPVGELLIGKRKWDYIEVARMGTVKEYQIISVS